LKKRGNTTSSPASPHLRHETIPLVFLRASSFQPLAKPCESYAPRFIGDVAGS
jgi:hypothetical protein